MGSGICLWSQNTQGFGSRWPGNLTERNVFGRELGPWEGHGTRAVSPVWPLSDGLRAGLVPLDTVMCVALLPPRTSMRVKSWLG